MIKRFFACTVPILASLLVGACEPAAETGPAKTGVEGFYDGNVIKWIIPYSPGGGYDEYGRLISPFLEKYTGARVDILNLPGAGGMRGVNELFNSSNDGLTIGSMNGSALITNELAGMRGADYKIGEFAYLGRIVSDRRVLVVALNSGFDSFEDLKAAGNETKIGATGLGGSTYVDAVIAGEALELKLDIIHGFDSSSVVRQAMLRGNIVGTWGSWGSALDSVDQGRDKVVLQSGRERSVELATVPTALEMAELTTDPERSRAILAVWESLHAVGRPLAAPPGTDPEKVKFLSAALDSALHDPELVAAAEKAGRVFDHVSASEMHGLVDEAMVMPDEIRQLFVKAILGELSSD